MIFRDLLQVRKSGFELHIVMDWMDVLVLGSLDNCVVC